MMILEELKEKTAKAHKELEQIPLLLPLSEGEIDREKYSKILKKFYGFFFPLEKLITSFEEIQIYLPDFPSRRKSNWIQRDLEFLGKNASDLSFCKDLPLLDSPACAFGSLYVMEGSTLGGSVISRRITAELGLSSDSGVSFFSGYGPETGKKWKTFKDALLQYSQQNQNDEFLIAAANDTFTKLSNWFKY